MPASINLGPATDQVYLVLYGTGLRGAMPGKPCVQLARGNPYSSVRDTGSPR